MSDYSPDETYTAEDLSNWAFDGTSLAVLGYPVRHSISPQMHNAALAVMAETEPAFANWRYFRFEIPPESLIELLPRFHEKGFFGLNLTVPHKIIAFDHIEKIDEAALPIGAINTLKRDGDYFKGYNTDGYGLRKGIETQLQSKIEGSEIILLGAGGASRAAAIECIQQNCTMLTIVNRSQDKLNKLIDELAPLADEKAIPIFGVDPKKHPPSISSDSIVINATSLGLKSEDPLPLPISALKQPVRLYDMIYNPPTTAIMREVANSKGRAANGLSMLVHQGVRSLEIWSERAVPVDTMVTSVNDAIKKD